MVLNVSQVLKFSARRARKAQRANKRCEKRSSFYTKKILLTSLVFLLYIPISNENKQKKGEVSIMADPAKYKSLSVKRDDWKELGLLADKTNRTRSSMIGRLIRFFKDNKGNGKKNRK